MFFCSSPRKSNLKAPVVLSLLGTSTHLSHKTINKIESLVIPWQPYHVIAKKSQVRSGHPYHITAGVHTLASFVHMTDLAVIGVCVEIVSTFYTWKSKQCSCFSRLHFGCLLPLISTLQVRECWTNYYNVTNKGIISFCRTVEFSILNLLKRAIF